MNYKLNVCFFLSLISVKLWVTSKFKYNYIMKNKLLKIKSGLFVAWIMGLAMISPMNAQLENPNVLRLNAESPYIKSEIDNSDKLTTLTSLITIVDRVNDNTTGLITTKGNNIGVYSADYFELMAPVDLEDITFYCFPSEGDALFLPNLNSFNVIIYENNGTIPDGDPENPGTGVLELTNIAPADFVYNDGNFTINVTQANGGQPVTLPAGEYWITAYPSVSTGPTDNGRWNWLGSLSASPTYEPVLIDPTDLFSAGSTSWTLITSLIAPDPFPSFAWKMTGKGCMLNFNNIEPITKVVLADIDNSSSASSSEGIEDFSQIEGEVEQGKSYTIELEGVTNGPFDNYFTVWIDWNQDGIWDSSPTSDEMYEIGFITNSTGTDGIKATGTIDVPQNAILGNTTMRIIKYFNSSPTNPCGTYGWGQAEDYTIVVVEPTSCEDVTNVAITNIGGTSATIDWDAVSGASDGYIIDVFEEGADPSIDVAVFNNSVAEGITTIQAIGLTPETDYEVYITSDCGNGTATSNAVSFTTDAVECNAVTNVEVSEIEVTEATISWTPTSTATDGYIVDVFDAGADSSIDTPVFSQTVDTTVTTIVATGLSPDTEYDVYVTSDCGYGETVISDVVSFTTEPTTNVDDFEVENLSVYPIPANANLNISASRTIDNIEVYNILGQLMLTINPNSSYITIDIRNLSAGNYILKVSAEDVIDIVRFIKK